MEPLGQPGHQPGLGGGQIHPRHANLGESQFACPPLNLRNELTAAEHTPQIVESDPVLLWQDEADTAAFAQRMAQLPALRNAFIALQGDLGAGKTTLVRHLQRALGEQGRIKSPTYAVVEPHEGAEGLQAWHFDFYRFSDPREWEDAGFRDIFASPGLKLAEWPDKAAAMLPTPDLVLRLDVATDDTRTVRLHAGTAAGQALLAGVVA